MKKFLDINFKYSDAADEKTYSPEVIKDCFVDLEDITKKVLNPNVFIVHAAKGAGKTALAMKILMDSEEDWGRFVDIEEVEDLEFGLLKKIGGQSGGKIGGEVSVWKLILLLKSIHLFCKCEDFVIKNTKFYKFKCELERNGFLRSPKITSILQETSRRGLYMKFKNIFDVSFGQEYTFEHKDPASLVDAIDCFIDQLQSDSEFIMVIDGLDYPVRRDRNNAKYIGDLISATRGLNHRFASAKLKFKIILLLRDEIIPIIPDPNLAKRLSGNGIYIDWYLRVRNPFSTELLKVIELRAKRVGFENDIITLWKKWFPASICKQSSIDFLLNNTRYLPRDLINVFRCIQSLGKEPPFSQDDVLDSLNSYSDWFRQELSDALVGLIPEDVRQSLDSIIPELGKEFNINSFTNTVVEHGLDSKINIKSLLSTLYSTSWIGHRWHENGKLKFGWKHRKRASSFMNNKPCYVHPGLWKAYNLI